MTDQTAIIGYFRRPEPEYAGERVHDACGRTWHDHGWLDVGGDGVTVCPDGYWQVGDTMTYRDGGWRLLVSADEVRPTPQPAAPVMQPAPQPRPLPILRYFDFTHLPEPLRQVSAEFASLAMYVADFLPPGPEQSVSLRKLLEAKDAAVRAGLDLPKPVPQVRTGDVCCGGMAQPSSTTTIGVGGVCCGGEPQTNEEGASHG